MFLQCFFYQLEQVFSHFLWLLLLPETIWLAQKFEIRKSRFGTSCWIWRRVYQRSTKFMQNPHWWRSPKCFPEKLVKNVMNWFHQTFCVYLQKFQKLLIFRPKSLLFFDTTNLKFHNPSVFKDSIFILNRAMKMTMTEMEIWLAFIFFCQITLCSSCI
jgi:hypothetical protein